MSVHVLRSCTGEKGHAASHRSEEIFGGPLAVTKRFFIEHVQDTCISTIAFQTDMDLSGFSKKTHLKGAWAE